MRRALVPGAVVALLLAVFPLTVQAQLAPAITLLSPAGGDVRAGVVSVQWSYKAFSRSAFVDVEAARGDGSFVRIARVQIDDGTPGHFGSFDWPTGPGDDGADYTVRLVVPSNKWARSSVSPVVIDNTAPEATEIERTPANDAGWNNGDVTVTWACTDATSGAVEPEVSATVVDEGTDQSASAVCTDLAGHSSTAVAEGINIDRTVPTAVYTARPPLVMDGMPPLIVSAIPGSSTDNLSGVASVEATLVDETGNETRRTASCAGCGTTQANWAVSVHGLGVGRYTVTAVATDTAGNTGTPITAEYFVVSEPALILPTVAPSDITTPEVTVPEATAPDVTIPEVTVPTLPSLELPV